MGIEILLFLIILAVLIILGLAIIFSFFFKKNKKTRLNMRSVSIQLIAIAVWFSILANIFIPRNNFLEGDTKLGLIIFLTSIVVGIFLIRSIFREIEIEKTVEILVKRINKNNEDLKKLERQKTEFVSIASHQLRGPISSIIGHISMMLEGDYGKLPDKFYEPLNRILKSSSSLSILVNDFLNVSRIEKGEMEYLIEDFDILTVISNLVPDFRIMAEQKKLKLEKKCPLKGIIVRGDVNKTRQALSNVIENAIKYTENGRVDINCDKNDDFALISIKDTGMGISPDFGKKIFEKFVRDEEAIKMDVAGTGLGLYVASVMTNSMGGSIWAESLGRNQGSTFFIKLPLSKG